MSIKQKIIDIKNNLKRKKLLKDIIQEYGKIIEKDDRLLCYIDKQGLEYARKSDALLEFHFSGYSSFMVAKRKLVDQFNLHKPIYYIFDGIDFSYLSIVIYSRNCNIIFKNCTFNKRIKIEEANEVVFENNTYNNVTNNEYFHSSDLYNQFGEIRKLTFKDEHFPNRYSTNTKKSQQSDKLTFDVDNLEIMNSTIDCLEPDILKIKAISTTIRNSSINATELLIDSDSIAFEESSMSVKTGITITNKNKDFAINFDQIYTPFIKLNGQAFEEQHQFNESSIKEQINDLEKLKAEVTQKAVSQEKAYKKK